MEDMSCPGFYNRDLACNRDPASTRRFTIHMWAYVVVNNGMH